MSDYDPPRGPLRVLYNDDHILLVDKPSGLLSVPGKGQHLADCLMARVQAVFGEALLVHRLDRDTSGVMVFAMNKPAQRHLGLQFENRQIKKSYVARVWGHIDEPSGVVDLPLCVDWPNRPLQMVDHENGKQAVTNWQVVHHEANATRVNLCPETGRSHQLRVHMMAIGHPVLGDPFYAEWPGRDATRLMLHAEKLSLRHPKGGRGLSFVAKCPF